MDESEVAESGRSFRHRLGFAIFLKLKPGDGNIKVVFIVGVYNKFFRPWRGGHNRTIRNQDSPFRQ